MLCRRGISVLAPLFAKLALVPVKNLRRWDQEETALLIEMADIQTADLLNRPA